MTNDPTTLRDILRQTIDSMARGPASLARKFCALALSEDVEVTDADLAFAENELLHEDANNPLRLAFFQRVSDWDHVDEPTWAAGTKTHTVKRRARIHHLLEWDVERARRCDALFPVITLQEPTVIAEDHEQWYTSERRERGFYWKAYADHLETRLKWDRVSVLQLERDASRVVAHLSDPERPEAFAARGLVVGYVQSGKTANFTAVIGKAADAGYRLFIVLTGMMDILRAQTQRRLDKELIGWEMCGGDKGDYRHDNDKNEFIRHGGPPSTRGYFDWERLTDAQSDYRELRRGVGVLRFTRKNPSEPLIHPDNLHSNSARIIVVKKNKQVLEKLQKDLRAFSEQLSEVPALVIDDESDQASPNTRKPGKPPTEVNKAIRGILGILPRGQYVGYTATPFANVFIDPEAHSDLFPRDFVISLERPTGYMGLREFFGIDVEHLDARPVGTPELVRPVRGEDAEDANLPTALDFYLLTGAVKLFRESVTPKYGKPYRFRHHTMLIHCSREQLAHKNDRDKVLALLAKAGWEKKSGLDRLRSRWETDILPICRARGGALPIPPDFDTLKPFLSECFQRLHRALGNSTDPVLIVNGDESEATTPNFEAESVWKILVGGNKLSRGYTVEGLTVSYYRRPARTADALMQMGRWFGFRHGYHDLVRLFAGVAEPGDRKGTTVNLIDAFVDTCILEEEFRNDLKKYAEPPNRIRPVDLYPLVHVILKEEKRLGPDLKRIKMTDVAMRPTSANKMRNVEIVGRNFGGDKFERTQAPVGPRAVLSNQKTLRTLFSDLTFQRYALQLQVDVGAEDNPFLRDLKDLLWHARAPAASVRDFLESYRWFDDKPLAAEILEYLNLPSSKTRIKEWQVITFEKTKSKGEPWKTGISNPENLAVIERGRPTRNRFGVYQEPQQAVFAEYLAGWPSAEARIRGGLTRGLQTLRDKTTGVLVCYLVRDPEAPEDVHVGFILRFPYNGETTRFFFRVRGSHFDLRPTTVGTIVSSDDARKEFESVILASARAMAGRGLTLHDAIEATQRFAVEEVEVLRALHRLSRPTGGLLDIRYERNGDVLEPMTVADLFRTFRVGKPDESPEWPTVAGLVRVAWVLRNLEKGR